MQESPQPIKEHKRCSRCKKEKSLSCFNKNKRSKDGLSEYCQICARKAKNKSYYKYHEQNKKKSREYNHTRKNQLKVNAWKYKGITLSIEDYDKLLKLYPEKYIVTDIGRILAIQKHNVIVHPQGV